MKLHKLKIKYEYLIEVESGNKTFELRKNDRDYKIGDLINFVCVDNETEEEIILNTTSIYKITYILKDVQQFGLDKDYCILSIKKLN